MAIARQPTREQPRPVRIRELIHSTLVPADMKAWDYQGVKTAMLDVGTAARVSKLPGRNGKYPDPLFVETSAAP